MTQYRIKLCRVVHEVTELAVPADNIDDARLRAEAVYQIHRDSLDWTRDPENPEKLSHYTVEVLES